VLRSIKRARKRHVVREREQVRFESRQGRDAIDLSYETNVSLSIHPTNYLNESPNESKQDSLDQQRSRVPKRVVTWNNGTCRRRRVFRNKYNFKVLALRSIPSQSVSQSVSQPVLSVRAAPERARTLSLSLPSTCLRVMIIVPDEPFFEGNRRKATWNVAVTSRAFPRTRSISGRVNGVSRSPCCLLLFLTEDLNSGNAPANVRACVQGNA